MNKTTRSKLKFTAETIRTMREPELAGAVGGTYTTAIVCSNACVPPTLKTTSRLCTYRCY